MAFDASFRDLRRHELADGAWVDHGERPRPAVRGARARARVAVGADEAVVPHGHGTTARDLDQASGATVSLGQPRRFLLKPTGPGSRTTDRAQDAGASPRPRRRRCWDTWMATQPRVVVKPRRTLIDAVRSTCLVPAGSGPEQGARARPDPRAGARRGTVRRTTRATHRTKPSRATARGCRPMDAMGAHARVRTRSVKTP